MSTLKEKIQAYKDLLDRKDELADMTKENNAAIKEAELEIAQQMIDEETPGIVVGEHSYTLAQTIRYSKRSEADLAAAGVEFFDVLREEGFGDLIVERVDPRTLQSAMKAYVEENGELSEELAEVITSYEEIGVNKRKASSKALARAKAEREASNE